MPLSQGDIVVATIRPPRGEASIVRLGWRHDGQIHTRLRRNSAATTAMVNDVPPTEFLATGGHLSSAELTALVLLLAHRRSP